MGRAPPVAAVNRPARLSAIRAAAAGSRTPGGDGQKTRALARDLFEAAGARHQTSLFMSPFYGVRCVTLQTSAPTRSIHANCGRAPSYSPDLNPIEQLFAKLKSLLRKAAARNSECTLGDDRHPARRLSARRMSEFHRQIQDMSSSNSEML